MLRLPVLLSNHSDILKVFAMPIRMSRKIAILLVVLALPVLIGGGYFSNMLTFTACEDELQAFSKEQWKGHGGGNGYVGELK